MLAGGENYHSRCKTEGKLDLMGTVCLHEETSKSSLWSGFGCLLVLRQSY